MSRKPAGDQLVADRPADDKASRLEALREAAQEVARSEVSDAVSQALANFDGSLRDLEAISGLDPAFVSRLSRGLNKQGGTVASLAQIALALDKSLHISIE
ncbi:MAG TPA: hypothetical protein VGB04_08760 [Allosphingosinicella sp.]|jgi:hexokinase